MMMTTKLLPCPFCEGPPCPIVTRCSSEGGGVFPDSELTLAGKHISAYVFCHECGAQGGELDDFVFNRKQCDELEADAVKLWNLRDNRHRDLYDSGEEQNLNEHPKRVTG